MKPEVKIISVKNNVYAYEIHKLGDVYGDGEVARIVCPAFDIDEEYMLTDIPEILETEIETILEKKEKNTTKKRVTLWLYEKDINYYKEQAQKKGLPYQ